LVWSSLLGGGGLGGSNLSMLFRFVSGILQFPLRAEGRHGVDVQQLAGEGSNPEVDLTGNLVGVVILNGVSAEGGIGIVVVLLFPDVNAGGGLLDVIILDLLALGVRNVHFVSKCDEVPGEKLAGLHCNVEEVVDISALVVKGKVGQPDEPVWALDKEESVGNSGPCGDFARALGPLEVLDVSTDLTLDVVVLNELRVPVVNLVTEEEEHGRLDTEHDVPLFVAHLGGLEHIVFCIVHGRGGRNWRITHL
jgi:hypothetical protein